MIIQISAIWCSSCLVMQKVYQKAKEEFPNLEWKIYDLDFDENEISKYNDLEKLPILIFQKNDQEINRLVGEKSREEVVAWIKENIK